MDAKPKITIGSAFYEEGELKNALIKHLRDKGFEVTDVTQGDPEDKWDYPEIAHEVGRRVSDGEFERGVLICGTGMGMSIVANKHPRVFAALVEDTYGAKYSRIYNNSNVLCLGQFITAPEKGTEILDTWLETNFADHPKWGPYNRDIALPQIAEIEEEVFK
jgi:ribose 5-phosphate isomerase B